ncbi:hypothetical protein [Streptomyces boncukensis]|uniref:Uncharacterized protein n=1 Tax=Streptomyces boncukensis TaxID=2711219 RepID=A0A6G4X3J2_9ACTN|nr:hypothetical protein [Streptomyces boncukensis]NGO71823.1 hypothetical protein [Streptomyces boncukensis]
MIRIDHTDIRTTDRLIEALYVAAGQHPRSTQAAEWHRIAAALEAALDALPPQPLHPVTTDLEVA